MNNNHLNVSTRGEESTQRSTTHFAPAQQRQQHGDPAQARSTSVAGKRLSSSNNNNPKKTVIWASRFKTSLCKNFTGQSEGGCTYEYRCMFAHGQHEIRTKEMNFKDGLITEETITKFQCDQRQLQQQILQQQQQSIPVHTSQNFTSHHDPPHQQQTPAPQYSASYPHPPQQQPRHTPPSSNSIYPPSSGSGGGSGTPSPVEYHNPRNNQPVDRLRTPTPGHYLTPAVSAEEPTRYQESNQDILWSGSAALDNNNNTNGRGGGLNLALDQSNRSSLTGGGSSSIPSPTTSLGRPSTPQQQLVTVRYQPVQREIAAFRLSSGTRRSICDPSEEEDVINPQSPSDRSKMLPGVEHRQEPQDEERGGRQPLTHVSQHHQPQTPYDQQLHHSNRQQAASQHRLQESPPTGPPSGGPQHQPQHHRQHQHHHQQQSSQRPPRPYEGVDYYGHFGV